MNAAPSYPRRNLGPRSGLVYLREQTARYFADNAIPAVVAPVGLKYRYFQLDQAYPGGAGRVVFIPGEFDGENAIKSRSYGTLNRQIRQSASVVNPRELLNWERAITVSIWSPPVPGSAENEELSIANAEDLLEQVVRALQNVPDPEDDRQNRSIAGSLRYGDILYHTPPVEGSFGVELLVSITQFVPLLDVTLDVVYPTAVVPRTGA